MRERQLLELIEKVHETVFVLDGWYQFSRALEDAVSGTSISLIVPTESDLSILESATTNNLEWYSPSLPPDYARSFLERFRYENPFQVTRSVGVGETPIHRTDQIVPTSELKRTSFFNEWMRPLGYSLGPNIVAYLYAGKPDMPALHLYRHQGRRAFGPADERAVGFLVPHMRQAVRARFALSSVRAEKNALEDVLDRLTLGVVLLDSDGKICGANCSAEDLLAARDGLEYARGELRAGPATGRLQKLVSEAARTGAGQGDGAGGAIALPRDDKRALVALVTPLRAPVGMRHGQVPAAALFLTDTDLDPCAVEELLGTVYDLTPREAELARKLAEGWSVEEAAARLGTEKSTERRRLADVFAKTNTHRQGELVRIVLKEAAQIRPHRGTK